MHSTEVDMKATSVAAQYRCWDRSTTSHIPPARHLNNLGDAINNRW
jgi:hypothetical protein